MPENKFGIYFNADTGEILRINSPYWIPEKPEWVCLTVEVNATLKEIRNIIDDQRLFPTSKVIFWGVLPDIKN